MTADIGIKSMQSDLSIQDRFKLIKERRAAEPIVYNEEKISLYKNKTTRFLAIGSTIMVSLIVGLIIGYTIPHTTHTSSQLNGWGSREEMSYYQQLAKKNGGLQLSSHCKKDGLIPLNGGSQFACLVWPPTTTN